MNTSAAMSERSLTIAEAADLVGMSKVALRARVERGTVKAFMRGGVRRIAVSELERVGLLTDPDADLGEPVPLTIDDVLDRLERQAEELGRLRERNAQLERELAAERTLRGSRGR